MVCDFLKLSLIIHNIYMNLLSLHCTNQKMEGRKIDWFTVLQKQILSNEKSKHLCRSTRQNKIMLKLFSVFFNWKFLKLHHEFCTKNVPCKLTSPEENYLTLKKFFQNSVGFYQHADFNCVNWHKNETKAKTNNVYQKKLFTYVLAVVPEL